MTRTRRRRPVRWREQGLQRDGGLTAAMSGHRSVQAVVTSMTMERDVARGARGGTRRARV